MYPRNRKSNRIQQPDALGSISCPTFPVMADSSFKYISVGQVLPLQVQLDTPCHCAETQMAYHEMPSSGLDGWRLGPSWTGAVDLSSRASYTDRNKKMCINIQKK